MYKILSLKSRVGPIYFLHNADKQRHEYITTGLNLGFRDYLFVTQIEHHFDKNVKAPENN